MYNLYEIIHSLCLRDGVKAGKMCNDLGLSRGMMTDLKMGRKQTLAAETLGKIAEYFGVTVDYLMGNEKSLSEKSDRPSDDDIKIALFGGDGEVTDEMWDEAIFAVQLIKERHKRRKDGK